MITNHPASETIVSNLRRALARRWLNGVLALALFGALPHAAAQYYGSAIRAGSTSNDRGFGVARDAAGNVYVTGIFLGTVDFDPGPGTTNLTSAGGSDIFVAKYTPTGTLIWARGMGGTTDDWGFAIAIDGAGNVVTTGQFTGTADFNPDVSATTTHVSAGGTDIFVSKLDSNGNFVSSRRMGGTGDDTGSGIAVDAANNVLTTGRFEGTVDFDPGAGTVNLTSGGSDDIFVSKLNSSGNFVWAKGIGAAGIDRAGAIAVDPSGNVLFTGLFAGTVDFDPGPATNSLPASSGTYDAFVCKLDSGGNFVWAKAMGGAGITDVDEGQGIAVNAAGDVFTTGNFQGTGDFDSGPGTFDLTSAGGTDIFVCKHDSNGNFRWARQLGGLNDDRGNGIAVDAAGNALVTGFFRGLVDFDPGLGKFEFIGAGDDDIFVWKSDSNGDFVWAKRMGTINQDTGNAIATDPASANVFITGSFVGTVDFDPGAGTTQLVSSGGSADIFLSRLTVHKKALWSQSGGATIIWTVDGLGVFVSSVNYGPFSGFTATSYGSHRDGTGRLLWTDPTSGYSGLWKLDANDALVSATLYGPFVGFTAAAYTADPEGSGSLHWTDTSGAQYIWNVDANGKFVSGLGYGVVPGFAIKSFVASP